MSIFDDDNTIRKKKERQLLNELYSKIEDYFDNCSKFGLQAREGQYDMALSVYDAIESFDSLIIEAGVGIGKSYAYLVPLMFYYSLTKKTFIVSTSTIALQEQLEKDISKLSNMLNISVEVVIAKGMSNFLCINRLDEFLNNKEKKKYTDKFDIEKQDRKYYSDIKDNLWKNICVENCLYSKCANCSKCEFYKRREKMLNTDGIIICNHDLLIEDLSRNSRKLLKNTSFIVCDEAHNLENKVRTANTKEIKINKSKEVIKEAIKALNKFAIYDYSYDKIGNKIDELQNHINSNVDKVINELKKQNIELDDCNGLTFTFDEIVINLSTELTGIIDNIITSIEIHSNKETEELEEQLYEYLRVFRTLSAGISGNNLFWIERKNKKNYIYYAPKNIDEISYRLFFSQKSAYYELFKQFSKTFIFTSATLSTGNNDFSYFMHNIGADKVKDNSLVLENSYDSPYNYDENALVYCCKDIPNPKDRNNYLNYLVIKIKELIKLTNGKALVLFTSKNDMNYVYEKIGNKIDNINIYIQNDGSSQDIVKNKFEQDINSVLFSTGIFWEGIDIKGKSLSNLIIARLPFPVVDPIIEYKKSLYGKDGFLKVYIPEMLIKLKQGVGRLIRSETDTGIICILDSRIEKYELKVKETLPIKNFVYDINKVTDFVDKKINL